MTETVAVNKQKILIITYPFPPIPYSGSYRTLRLCKGLAKLGVEVHVLTIKIDSRLPNDFGLLSQVPGSVAVHRIPIIDPWIKYQHWKKNRLKNGFRCVNKLFSFLMRLIVIPDHQNLWVSSAVTHGAKIIKKYNIKTILISSPPNSSQLIGYFLKKRTNVKWIADFRDPIIGNIAATHLINPKGIIAKIESRLLGFLEKIVVKNSDIAIANTETHRKELKGKFKTDKFVTIRNAFDEDDYKDITSKKYEKFTIAHIGSMYGLRKADILFKAIKSLEKAIALQALKLQVFFVGNSDDALNQSIIKHGVEKYVEIKGMVPHKEAIQIMMRSHLLLLIKATGKGSLGQIPAKFFEYLGTNNRILCLGSAKSEVAHLITKLKAGYVIEKDKDFLVKTLMKEYKRFVDCNMQLLRDYDKRELSSDFMAKAVKGIIL